MTEIDEGLIGGEQIVLRTNKHWFAPLADSGIAILMLLGVVVLAWLQPNQPDGFLSFIWRVVDLLQLGLFLELSAGSSTTSSPGGPPSTR